MCFCESACQSNCKEIATASSFPDVSVGITVLSARNAGFRCSSNDPLLLKKDSLAVTERETKCLSVCGKGTHMRGRNWIWQSVTEPYITLPRRSTHASAPA